MTDVPSNLIPTRVTQLPEYEGDSTEGYSIYALEGRTYKAKLANIVAPLADDVAIAAAAAEAARDAAQTYKFQTEALVQDGADSALLAQAWAEGTEPGGPNTNSSKGWSYQSQGFALSLETDAAGGFYDSLAAGVADPAVAVGDAFNIIEDGRHYVGRKTGASTGEIVAEYATTGFAEAISGPGGAGEVGSDDGAGGTLWTTVAGFISRLMSSAGASVIGFIQAGAGAVARKVDEKLFEIVSIADFGASPVATEAQNTTRINAAIAAAHAAGGGFVFVPEGEFTTNGNIKLLDNVYLLGAGYASHIHNSATSGFAKCTVVSGNIGDPNGLNSLFDEAGYDLAAIAPGDVSVSLITAGDAANFAVGDIVGIASYERWTLPAGTHEKLLNVNEIIEISGSTIKLRYGVPDAYASSAGNRPTIRPLSGTINGYDGQPLWMSKNCGASNLRITQSTGLASGWYALFPCGVNQHYENLWMDDCSTLMGSNALSHSTFRNIQGRFEAGFWDAAEWQNNNLCENVEGFRFAANPALNKIGLSNNNGTDNIFRNVRADLGGWGGFSLTKIFRGKFDRCRVANSGSASDPSTQAILLGYGTDCEAISNEIVNQHKHGIQLVGERHRAAMNSIPATNASYYAVYAPATLNTAYVHDNAFGVAGAYTTRDRFFQQTAQSPNVVLSGNTGYVEHQARKGGGNWAGFASTSGTSLTTLRTVALPGTTGVVRGYKVLASGVRSGTASTKTVNLKLGSTVLAQVNYAAADTGAFVLEAVLNVRPSTDAVHVNGRSWNGSTMQSNLLQTIAAGLVSDVNLVVDAQCANASDTVALYQMVVEPIMEQLQ